MLVDVRQRLLEDAVGSALDRFGNGLETTLCPEFDLQARSRAETTHELARRRTDAVAPQSQGFHQIGQHTDLPDRLLHGPGHVRDQVLRTVADDMLQADEAKPQRRQVLAGRIVQLEGDPLPLVRHCRQHLLGAVAQGGARLAEVGDVLVDGDQLQRPLEAERDDPQMTPPQAAGLGDHIGLGVAGAVA